MPVLSIIVPVYNTEQYLCRCIDSILSQAFSDFELLLIDDGSRDGSGMICDEYAKRDSRIRVFHKENGGVSSARNMGLDNACGDWVYFFDSDDEMMVDGVATLMDGCRDSKVDFVTAGYEQFSPEGKKIFATVPGKQGNGLISRNAAIGLMYRDVFYQFYTPSKLFRRSLIETIGLRFDESLYFSEDRLFIIRYLCGIRNDVYYTTKPVFKYLLRDTGTMLSLKNGFNYKSVTGFYAALMMYQVLNANKEVSMRNRNIAAEDVVYSYRLTRWNMRKASVDDGELKKHLIEKLYSALPRHRYYFFCFIFSVKEIRKGILSRYFEVVL